MPPLENTRHEKFAQLRASGLTIDEAYAKAGYKPHRSNAARLSANEVVKARIAELTAAAAEKAEITAAMVLRRWWDLFTADPNELVQYRRTCCRHCHGKNHAFQWIGKGEYEMACALARKEERDPPSNAGGYGYDHTREPHPNCPECHGEGRGSTFIADTRNLKGPARLLYAGIKETRDGIEVKMHDQLKASELIARHLGMFKDQSDVPGVKGLQIVVVRHDGGDAAD